MSIQICKATREVGRADEQGASFLATQLMTEVQRAYLDARKIAENRGMPVNTARVIVTVEQEFVQTDLPGEGEN